MKELEIQKGGNYEIIVFPNQDEGLRGQRELLEKKKDFKHISTLAVVVKQDACQELCRILLGEGVSLSGHYPFLYRDYEDDFFKKAKEYSPLLRTGGFLKSITLCYVAPCMADEKKIRLIAYFDRDISEVLPYLNAVIKGASYNKNAATLTFAKERRLINLYNIKVTIARADDIIDAWKVMDEVKDLINRTYENKENIQPDYEGKVKVTALQLYGWLPKTNCRLCGEATCLAFALRLLQGAQKLDCCEPLATDNRFAENRKIMREMTEALGIG